MNIKVKQNRFIRWVFGSVTLCVIVLGVICYPYARAYLSRTDHFIKHNKDQRVRFEKGGKPLANHVVKYLPAAVKRVETVHGSRFKSAVVVYVCATLSCYKTYTTRKRSRGAVFAGRLFLSPGLLQRQKTIKGILVHELSHLHLTHLIGKYSYNMKLPAWFKEGIAVLVSGDGGAENVSRTDASRAITAGKSFVPNSHGSLLFHKNARKYGFHRYNKNPKIYTHMYYRQAGLFVEFLYYKDTDGFQKMIEKLAGKHSFSEAVFLTYNKSIPQLWKEFITSLKSPI